MLTDSRIVYLFLYVSDLAQSKEFFEATLGLSVLEEDAASVKYDCGHLILALNRADDYGVILPGEPDHSTDIVFLVNDLDEARDALEARGVKFTETHRYEIGAICDFYDQDGHWFTLYETSDEAMTWPSGDRIATVRRLQRAAAEQPSSTTVTEPAKPTAVNHQFTLDGKPIIYLFLFVRNADEAFALYAQTLGLVDLEGGPCSRASNADEEGVVKYDTGGVILTTHSLETVRDDHEIVDHPCPPRTVNPVQMGGKAVVFHVTDIDKVSDELADRGVKLGGRPTKSEIGAIAEFTDPSGHKFYLYEPSEAAWTAPSGRKMRQILDADL